jgi:hypothetical protein
MRHAYVSFRAGGEHFFSRQKALKPHLRSPYTLERPYRHTDMHTGALVPVLLKARPGFEAEGPKMLQLLRADEWTLDFMAARPQDFPCAEYESVRARLAAAVAATGRGAALALALQQDPSRTQPEQCAALCVRRP